MPHFWLHMKIYNLNTCENRKPNSYTLNEQSEKKKTKSIQHYLPHLWVPYCESIRRNTFDVYVIAQSESISECNIDNMSSIRIYYTTHIVNTSLDAELNGFGCPIMFHLRVQILYLMRFNESLFGAPMYFNANFRHQESKTLLTTENSRCFAAVIGPYIRYINVYICMRRIYSVILSLWYKCWKFSALALAPVHCASVYFMTT